MRSFAIIYILIILSANSFAQVEKQLLPSDLKQQTIVTEPFTLPRGFIRSGITLTYGVVDKYFDGSGEKRYHMNSSWGSSAFYLLTFQYGISNRLMVDISVPLKYSRQKYYDRSINPESNSDLISSSSFTGSGIGDGNLNIRYQLIPEDGENSYSLVWKTDLTIPTGSKNPREIRSLTEYTLPTGNGVFVAGGVLQARKVQYPYSIEAYLGYLYKFSGSKLINIDDSQETYFKPGNTVEAGAGVTLHLNEWIALANELSFSRNGAGEIHYSTTTTIDPTATLYYESKLVFQIRRIRVAEAVKVPVKGRNVPADPQYVITLQYIF